MSEIEKTACTEIQNSQHQNREQIGETEHLPRYIWELDADCNEAELIQIYFLTCKFI